MEKEILACIDDKNIKYLQSGQISKYVFPMEREQAHKQNVSHLITRFFVLSKNIKGETMYLLQKRSKAKTTFPEYFTDSSSGHVLWSKNLNLQKIRENALRELEEEFGIHPKDIQKMSFYELTNEINGKTREVSYVFLGLVDFNISLNPDPSELDINDSRFYNREELENILKYEKSIDYSKKIWKKILTMDINNLFKKKNDRIIDDNTKNIALFIGRFQPLHHGHIYILRNILKTYKSVKIGIGSSQISNTKNDPFSSKERKNFLTLALKKRRISSTRYKIFNIPDIFNAKAWVEHVITIVGEFDSVYSNSDWIRELFQKKGYKVEKKIEIFKKKFNANNIRNLIAKDNSIWKNLVPNEVINYIEEIGGIARIKSLYEKNGNS